MRALLAGYASRFNRRHDRVGHLFQNRYKSTLCDDETYFLKLVQYIHLNPVPSVVSDVETLARYPWTGHSTLLGFLPRAWQETTAVLDRFAQQPVDARVLYENFVREGIGAASSLDGGASYATGRDGTTFGSFAAAASSSRRTSVSSGCPSSSIGRSPRLQTRRRAGSLSMTSSSEFATKSVLPRTRWRDRADRHPSVAPAGGSRTYGLSSSAGAAASWRSASGSRLRPSIRAPGEG